MAYRADRRPSIVAAGLDPGTARRGLRQGRASFLGIEDSLAEGSEFELSGDFISGQ